VASSDELGRGPAEGGVAITAEIQEGELESNALIDSVLASYVV
jgi:hypothetical protein